MDANECVVCYGPLDGARVRPCDHPFCAPCITRWMAQGSTCPVCRTTIAAIEHAGDDEGTRGNDVLISRRLKEKHVGVRLSLTSRGFVYVSSLDPRDCAYTCGVRKGDVISHINNVPVSTPRQAINILDVAKEYDLPIVFTILKRPPRRTSMLRCLAAAFLVDASQ